MTILNKIPYYNTMGMTDYVRYFDPNNRKRHFHEHDRGRVVRFTIQYETKIGDTWHEVIRYDGGHGFAHKDIYNRHGRKLRQIPLSLDFTQATIFADRDLNENWERYDEWFLRT